METEKGAAVHGRVRQQAKVKTREAWAGYKKTQFPHKDRQAVVSVAQRSCAGSILGSFQHQLDKALSRLA